MNTEIENKNILLENINPKNLPELQGWKNKQEQLLNDNAFLVITDNSSYQEAKKRRTALVTGRTTIERQDKLIASKIKSFRSKVSDASKELIAITLPHEEKQQAEVKRYEDVKIQEKAKKERLEAERKQGIESKISTIFNNWSNTIKQLTYDGIENFKMQETIESIDVTIFEEYEIDFAKKVEILQNQFQEKKQQLETFEKQRLENERLKKERELFEREKAEREAKEKIEREKREKEQARIDAENNRIANELSIRKAKIEKEQARIDKIESDRIAKEKAEKQARIDAEREAKEAAERLEREEADKLRKEGLKPDADKISKFIESLNFALEEPEIKDETLRSWLKNIIIKQRLAKESMQIELSQHTHIS